MSIVITDPWKYAKFIHFNNKHFEKNLSVKLINFTRIMADS